MSCVKMHDPSVFPVTVEGELDHELRRIVYIAMSRETADHYVGLLLRRWKVKEVAIWKHFGGCIRVYRYGAGWTDYAVSGTPWSETYAEG